MTDGPAIAFYWRPGCGFCARLHHALDRLGIVVRHHNIWEDADAAATVRSIARGTETVPTVVVGPVGVIQKDRASLEVGQVGQGRLGPGKSDGADPFGPVAG